jgi:hypothetical protein
MDCHFFSPATYPLLFASDIASNPIFVRTIRIYHSIGENTKKFLISEGLRVGKLLADCWVEFSKDRISSTTRRWISAMLVAESGLLEFPLEGGVDGSFTKRQASIAIFIEATNSVEPDFFIVLWFAVFEESFSTEAI